MTDADRRARLDWRYVHDPCLICDGSGVRYYTAFATWKGGLSGHGMHPDICDACWGTGDRFRHGVDLRQLAEHEEARIAEAAVTALADAVGISGRPSVAVHSLIAALRQLADPPAGKRRPPQHDDITFSPLVRELARVLELAQTAPRAAPQHRMRRAKMPEAERLLRVGYMLARNFSAESNGALPAKDDFEMEQKLNVAIAAETENHPRGS